MLLIFSSKTDAPYVSIRNVLGSVLPDKIVLCSRSDLSSVLALPNTSYMILNELYNSSEPEFPPLCNNKNSTYLISCL